MPAREQDEISVQVVRPGEAAGVSCRVCGPARPGRAAPVTRSAWEDALRRAAGRQAHEVRLAGAEPLLAPGMLDALGASSNAGGASTVAVETHGLAWACVPPTRLAALPIARWELIVHTLDAGGSAALLGRTDASALRAALDAGPPGDAPVAVTWEPAPGDLATPAALPAWVLEHFGAGSSLTVRAPRGPQRPALLERQLVTLAASNRRVHLPLRVDRGLPACVHHHLPAREVEIPDSPLASAPRQRHAGLCRGCPQAERGRCDGVPEGWRVTADDARHLRRVARAPAHRGSATDAELLALRLGLRRVVRMALPARQAPLARLALESEGWAVVGSTARILDADGNLFRPGAQPSVESFGAGGQTKTHHVLYIAAKAAEAEAARDLEARISDAARPDAVLEAHRDLGALLGYPACCVEAFVAELTARAGEAECAALHAARARAAAARSARLDPLANGFLVARDRALVSHAPCRFDCPATLALARAVQAELARNDEATAAARLAALASAVALHVDGSVLVAHVTETADGPRLAEILRSEGRLATLKIGDAFPSGDERTLVLRFDLP